MLARCIELRWPVAVAFATALVLAWQALGAGGALPDYLLTPVETAEAVIDALRAGQLGPAVAASLVPLLVGFALGAGSGVILGLFAGVNRFVDDAVDPLVSFTYPLPKVALFPIFAVWFGYTDTSRIVVIALACLYPAYVNAYSATRGIDPRQVRVALNLGASPWQRFRHVIWQASLPRVLVGVRISLATSFVLLFAVETIAPADGLGTLIFVGYQSGNPDLMFAGIATLATLGFVSDRLLARVGAKLTRGHEIGVVGSRG